MDFFFQVESSVWKIGSAIVFQERTNRKHPRGCQSCAQETHHGHPVQFSHTTIKFGILIIIIQTSNHSSQHFRLSLPPIEKKTQLDIIHFCIDRVTFWSSFQTKTLMAPEYVKTASEVVLAIFHWRYVGSHCNVDSQFFIWYMFEPKRRKC